MKKRISLVAITLLMTVALTACGKTENVSVRHDDDDDTTESRTVVTTPVEEPEVSATVEEQTSSEPEIVETEPEVKPVVTPIEEFEYKHDDELGGMVITKYNGSIPMVIIPDEIDGEPVVAIGEEAFDKSEAFLESISMPDTVKLIGSGAFCGCRDLTNVKLSSSLETIKDFAFGACGFSEITLPESLKCIGDFAFNKCENLKSVTIPEGVEIIEDGAFLECTNLETVNLHDKITAIDSEAFARCGIKKITLPDNITKIGYNVFVGNKNIIISYKGSSYAYEDMVALSALIAKNATSATETSATN
ncbi:MAG: leucine-rich repeat domain-containing protein [Oscillospiraceae bacterium]